MNFNISLSFTCDEQDLPDNWTMLDVIDLFLHYAPNHNYIYTVSHGGDSYYADQEDRTIVPVGKEYRSVRVMDVRKFANDNAYRETEGDPAVVPLYDLHNALDQMKGA